MGIVFDLVGGQIFADVLSELALGTLRIGIHVQGFAGEGSESFVNVSPIPLPAALPLFGTGLGIMGFIGWRRKRRIAAAAAA